MKRIKRSFVLFLIIILLPINSYADTGSLVLRYLGPDRFRERVYYDMNNELHFRKQEILNKPNHNIKDVRIYDANKTEELLNINKEIASKDLSNSIKTNHSARFKEKARKVLEEVDSKFFSLFEEEYDFYFISRVQEEYRDALLESAVEVLSFLSEDELELLKGTNIFIMPKVMGEDDNDGNKYYVNAFAEHLKFTDSFNKNIYIANPTTEFGTNIILSDYKKQVKRTLLHELGHIINYEIENTIGKKEFLSRMYKFNKKYEEMKDNKKWEWSLYEDFTESFVVEKIKELNLDLGRNTKKTNYPYLDTFKDFYLKLIEETLSLKKEDSFIIETEQ